MHFNGVLCPETILHFTIIIYILYDRKEKKGKWKEKRISIGDWQMANGEWRITRHVRVYGDHPSAANL